MQQNKIILILFFLLINYLPGQNPNRIAIHSTDTVYHKIGPDFFGIQYHSNTYADQNALNLLDDLNLKIIRIWAEVEDFHPQPNVWNWEELDQQINEITAAGYEAVPCLWGEKWFIGSADTAWWNYEQALLEWDKAASELAKRYKDKLNRIIIFDELNMLHTEKDFYIPFKDAAKLYLRAAKKIKAVDPDIACGGPSGFGSWENGHWANYVLDEVNGLENLDFISSNTFLSWDSSDSDHQVLAKTIWYEEMPLKIREMLNNKAHPKIMLDAYNLSALWTLNGELWTDPRNTNLIGGIYQIAALLHSAKGGTDIALHWETLGGYGILSWFPKFEELPPYYSWKFLIETAGFVEGSEIIGCKSDALPDSTVSHLGGMDVNSFIVQPFALRRTDGDISVILINKHPQTTYPITLTVPAKMKSYSLYRFDETRMADSFLPIKQENNSGFLDINCPPYSTTVIRFSSESVVGIMDETEPSPQFFRLSQNVPNPFNSQTRISIELPKASHVILNIFDIQGRHVQTFIDKNLTAGTHNFTYDASTIPSGVYYYQMKTGHFNSVLKLIHLK